MRIVAYILWQFVWISVLIIIWLPEHWLQLVLSALVLFVAATAASLTADGRSLP